MPKLTKSIAKFDFVIDGIPCQIAVTDYEPYVEGRFSGPPENCYPSEGGYGDYRVLDRKGYIAEWLERKINDRIESEIQETIAAHFEQDDKDYDDDAYTCWRNSQYDDN